MPRELSESEYIETLMSDLGLQKSNTIGDLLQKVIQDETELDDGDL